MTVNRTEIKCPICKGTTIGAHGQKCGACFGTGFSSAPYDQPRNATTTGVNEADFRKAGIHPYPEFGRHTKKQIMDAILVGSPDIVDLRIEGEGYINRAYPISYAGILITWENTQYANRLELDKQNKLYL